MQVIIKVVDLHFISHHAREAARPLFYGSGMWAWKRLDVGQVDSLQQCLRTKW